MSHALVGMSSVALVAALCPPPNGKMSYATTGAVLVRWNALPMPVPCTAVSTVLMPGVMPVGQSVIWNGLGLDPKRFKKRIATSPALS